MSAVYIDAAVVDGSNTKHWPSPAYPFYPPVIINGQTTEEISNPALIYSSSTINITTPIVLDSASIMALSIPASLAYQAPIDIGSPVDLTESEIVGIATPIAITGSTVLELIVPIDISESAIVDITTPTTITIVAVENIAIPISISSASLISISAPVSVSTSAAVEIAIPVDITESAVVDIAVPVAISANSTDPESPPFALNHARILYDNLLLSSSVTISTGATGTNVLIPNTAQRWTFSATGNIKFVLPDNFDIDTVCIGAHNLSSGGYTVQVFYRTTDGGSLTSLTASKSPVNDNAIMFHVPATVSAKVIEIYTTAGSGAGYIGSIYAGVALQMQRPFYGGHSPITLSASTTYFSSRSESGAFIGREIRKREYQTSAAWKNITDSWYRAYFQPFVLSAKTLPFYFAWNLLEHSSDVAYCITNADISPSYQGNRDLMQVGFDMIGVG